MDRRIALALVALAAFAASCTGTPSVPPPPKRDISPDLDAPPLFVRTPGKQVIPGEYIVVFTDAVADAKGKASEKVLRHNGKMRFTYDKALKGFAASLSDEAVALLRADPDVAYVEEDE